MWGIFGGMEVGHSFELRVLQSFCADNSVVRMTFGFQMPQSFIWIQGAQQSLQRFAGNKRYKNEGRKKWLNES
ncbi:MAG: hypothetical protein ACTHMB_08350 [Candidatus Binatia bacterium]